MSTTNRAVSLSLALSMLAGIARATPLQELKERATALGIEPVSAEAPQSVPGRPAGLPGSQAAGASSGLTNETLGDMLTALGFQPKPLSQGYLIQAKRGTATMSFQLLVSPDGSKVGMNANLGTVKDGVTAEQWKNLLAANEDIDPTYIYFQQTKNRLMMHRVLDNAAVTSNYLSGQIDRFVSDILRTEPVWSVVVK